MPSDEDGKKNPSLFDVLGSSTWAVRAKERSSR